MPSHSNDLNWAHPLVQEWFTHKFGTPTKPQALGWPSILAKKATLISAPTGSGKTLAAFLACIDGLVRQALNDNLKAQTEVVYVSPLKALSNDIHKNLLEPLKEIAQLAQKQNLKMAEIRVAVRTGDTPTSERAAMLKKPPHILVTTPESFYILLTAEKSRLMLNRVDTVIVDEIHALANNKRGTHLSLSLERLDALSQSPITRIGLSATQKPIEKVAQFLIGNRSIQPNIVNMGHLRQMDLAVVTPIAALSAVATNEMWDEIYNKIAELVLSHRSTLIFVNTRRLAERVAHHLAERLGEDKVATHHGSLSRKLRHTAENQLKNGELAALVATASLELGIDIGTIDLVCQVGSPRAISITLQRIGRAGHWYGAIPKGRIFATTRDELMECAALMHAVQEQELDELVIPEEPLDILSQQIVAICATGDWLVQDLFTLVKKAYSYKNLSQETFSSLLNMLSEGIEGLRGRHAAYLFYDRINGVVKARRNARLTAIMNGGAIPENGLFTVVLQPSGTVVGTLDEDFAIDSHRGDIILLGTTSWRIARIESISGRVLVEDAHGAPPNVPFWRGEAPGRTLELSATVALLRQKISDFITPNNPSNKEHAVEWLKKHCLINGRGAMQLIDYILQGQAILGCVPTQKQIIAERFFDESGGMQLIIHAPFGSRINKAWGLALRKKFCRSFNFELQAAATEEGINISLSEQHSFPLADVFKFVHSNTVKETVVQAALQSPLFPTRWRWDASRSLAIKRFRNGKKIPPNIQRMMSEDLLAAVFPDAAACQDNLAGQDIVLPDHPLINETIKDVLNEALDIKGLTSILQSIENGAITCVAVDTPVASPFAHEILNANPYAFLDDAPLEERRARAVEMRLVLPESILKDVGKLDQEGIDEVKKQAWPDVRNADELHDVLMTLIVFPIHHAFKDYREPPNEWNEFFSQLKSTGRVNEAFYLGKTFWVAAERLVSFQAAYPSGTVDNQKLSSPISLDPEKAIANIIQGWLLFSGPITVAELNVILDIDIKAIELALIQIETTGAIFQGHFREQHQDHIEWCERRLLARIHRFTIEKLRKEIEAVSAEQFFQWLLTWQHVAPGTQLSGEGGLLAIIKQLQGFEIPASAWEKKILSKRLSDYSPQTLDHLCLTGRVGWGRLSPLPKSWESKSKKIRPTRTSPITFFIRDEANWLPDKNASVQDEHLSILSHPARKIYNYLQEKGALFFSDIIKNVSALKSEIESGLWELVSAGLVTADGFDNLRALIDEKRKNHPRRRRVQGRLSMGRWSLLTTEAQEESLRFESVCWLLLNRYGIVFRDLLVREKNIPQWRDLLKSFRRLENQGQIRGGRFVKGFYGEQFALPHAVSSLRASKKQKEVHPAEIYAADPLNLTGVILPGDKISSLSKKKIQH